MDLVQRLMVRPRIMDTKGTGAEIHAPSINSNNRILFTIDLLEVFGTIKFSRHNI